MTTTAIAPTNIAVLKYWGKNPAWEKLLIPSKSSLSFTVDGLQTRTTLESSEPRGRPGIEFTLNGEKTAPSSKEHEYVAEFIAKIGSFFPAVGKYGYRIASENNFPTSAGFASSASGFAALVKALAGEVRELAPLREDDRKLSALARLGSGSASRSIPGEGGFVEWKRGLDFTDRRDPDSLGKEEVERAMFSSCSETLFPPGHWPEFRMIYAKVRSGEKKVKSRAGMKASIETNPLYGAWVEHEESRVRPRMIDLVRRKDFPALALEIMKASNSLHQICLGTYPPIVYLDQTSLAIMDAVHSYNEGGVKAAYTFDAGPNAVVFTLANHELEVVSLLGDIVGADNVSVTRMGPGARLSDDHLF
jgi:diphosphomevalonate decarboxylase